MPKSMAMRTESSEAGCQTGVSIFTVTVIQDDIVILTLSLPKGKNPRILLAARYITPSLKLL
jgi:hypothetical protein